MRKTSHDGADTSSITSGIDNEKKSATNFNKLKKSSIKRKVQNFSHESDDGIIEPLLQTEKEKIEIANRSAKYLLNKTKTEKTVHEKDNKVTDGYADKSSVPLLVSSTSNVITNNMKDSSMSTSYTCEAAAIHNHMNTNIFSTFDVSTGLITTKNSILVEIDSSKSGRYSPSPLIFTTAKIHTDTKTKPMEPVQVTPVPILSTIEGNIVKAGVVSNAETKNITLPGKAESNVLQPCKDKAFSPPVTLYFPKSDIAHSSQTMKNKPLATVSSDCSVNFLSKNVNVSHMLNTVSKPQSVGNDILKQQSDKDMLPTVNKITIPDSIKQSIEIIKPVANSKNKSEKHSPIDKLDEKLPALDNLDNKIAPTTSDTQNLDAKDLKSPGHLLDRTVIISKDNELVTNSSDSSNKKIQHQNKTPSVSTYDSVNIIPISDTQSHEKEAENNVCIKTVKVSLPPLVHKSEHSARTTVPIDTKDLYKKSTKDVCTTKVQSTEIKGIPSTISASTSKVKSISESGSIKSTLSGVSKEVPKLVRKSSIAAPDVKDNKVSTTAAIKPTSGGASTSTKFSAIPVSMKPDTLSSSSSSSQSVKTDQSLKCPVTTVNSTLPSYIVSTSKTKIGSTLTSTTPATTSKSQIQKPLVSNTASAQVKQFTTPSAKSIPSSSAANGTKHAVFPKQTKSKPETIKKDGRA
ncbi:phosphatidylinositol 3-kinase 2-like isoform X1 [Bicyclus anynana]|uniref:Phosphatidylinositol 3-kinase 2-like isoform X1 n=1 Tax=Bicyclus anynana TaxID=110368 RepID=A0A6J1NRC5_BICAN|nr:phosphatidylinositol 3-kinase 2-like isoform X1 [Bicyclus anynana]